MRQALLGMLIAVTTGFAALAVVSGAFADSVDIRLVLAADVSRSVDNDEFRLQREGYAAAITDPKVIAAIQAGTLRSIAVSFVEWSGAAEQRVVADWTVVRDDETAAVFANVLRSAPRSYAGATAIGNAVDFAMRHFDNAGVDSPRRIIDVSGDGDNNGGRAIEYARDDAVASGVTINGLAIVNAHPNPGFISHIAPPGGIGEYYRSHVIGGPGSFVLLIEDFTTFAAAVTQKLATEIAGAAAPRRLAASEVAAEEAVR
ncbi:MAG: DUF1194 domain-containing protein [Hyphomicrobiales bacterium]|nr:DUF1194 domain-containing protein [Hyphomicrobiales bacterium]